MTKSKTKAIAKMGTAAVVVTLLGILVMAGWYAAKSWTSVDGPPMPTAGYIAMIFGVIFSVGLGCGLMALVFYSSRYGYDERANQDQHLAEDS